MRQVPISDSANTGRLIALLLVIFLDSFAYFLVIPVFLRLFIHDDLGLIAHNTPLETRNMWYGLSMMLSALASILTAPFIGYLSDKYGRKKIILLCLISTLIGLILPLVGIFSKSLSLILVGRLITGVATGNQPVAQAAITDFSSGKQKAFYLSLIALMMTLGMVLGPLAGGYLLDTHGGPLFNVMMAYELGIGVSIISIILLLFFFPAGAQSDQPVPRLANRRSLSSLWKISTRSLTGLLLLVFFLLELAWSQYYQVIPLYLSEHVHYAVTHTASFVSYIGVWMLLGLAVLYPIIVRYFSVKKITTASIILASIGFIICALFPGMVSQWMGVILIAIFVGVSYCCLLALISHTVAKEHPTQHQGAIMGLASALLQGAWMITAFSSGWLINIYHHLPLLCGMIFMVLGALFLGLWLQKTRKQPQSFSI